MGYSLFLLKKCRVWLEPVATTHLHSHVGERQSENEANRKIVICERMRGAMPHGIMGSLFLNLGLLRILQLSELINSLLLFKHVLCLCHFNQSPGKYG